MPVLELDTARPDQGAPFLALTMALLAQSGRVGPDFFRCFFTAVYYGDGEGVLRSILELYADSTTRNHGLN